MPQFTFTASFEARVEFSQRLVVGLDEIRVESTIHAHAEFVPTPPPAIFATNLFAVSSIPNVCLPPTVYLPPQPVLLEEGYRVEFDDQGDSAEPVEGDDDDDLVEPEPSPAELLERAREIGQRAVSELRRPTPAEATEIDELLKTAVGRELLKTAVGREVNGELVNYTPATHPSRAKVAEVTIRSDRSGSMELHPIRHPDATIGVPFEQASPAVVRLVGRELWSDLAWVYLGDYAVATRSARGDVVWLGDSAIEAALKASEAAI